MIKLTFEEAEELEAALEIAEESANGAGDIFHDSWDIEYTYKPGSISIEEARKVVTAARKFIKRVEAERKRRSRK